MAVGDYLRLCRPCGRRWSCRAGWCRYSYMRRGSHRPSPLVPSPDHSTSTRARSLDYTLDCIDFIHSIMQCIIYTLYTALNIYYTYSIHCIIQCIIYTLCTAFYTALYILYTLHYTLYYVYIIHWIYIHYTLDYVSIILH